jgi:hypothetical protein
LYCRHLPIFLCSPALKVSLLSFLHVEVPSTPGFSAFLSCSKYSHSVFLLVLCLVLICLCS